MRLSEEKNKEVQQKLRGGLLYNVTRILERALSEEERKEISQAGILARLGSARRVYTKKTTTKPTTPPPTTSVVPPTTTPTQPTTPKKTTPTKPTKPKAVEVKRRDVYYLGWASNTSGITYWTICTERIPYAYVIKHICMSVQGYGADTYYKIIVARQPFEKNQRAVGRTVFTAKYITHESGSPIRDNVGIYGYQDGYMAGIGDVNAPYNIFPNFLVNEVGTYICLTAENKVGSPIPAHVDAFITVEEI